VVTRPDCDNGSDEEVVARAIADPAHFTCIIRRYEAPLTRYLGRSARLAAEDVQDLLQDLFIKVYRNLNDFDQTLKFSSWIYRIAHNEMVSRFRSHPWRATVDAYDERLTLPAEMVDRLTGDVTLERQQLARALQEIIDSLPDRYREAFVLRFVEEKEYAEIGDILQKPMGSVATLINRAREHFRKEALRRGINVSSAMSEPG
jgi:RNA polymerase sigma-70 factor, ECF subfamily